MRLHRTITIFLILLPTLAQAENERTEERRALLRSAQVMRRESQLLRAKELLASCGAFTCDEADEAECKAIGTYCARKAEEVEAEIPSIVPTVVDDLGQPIVGATAHLLTSELRLGEEVPVNPGTLLLRASYAGRTTSVTLSVPKSVKRMPARLVIDLRTTAKERPLPWYTASLAGLGVGALITSGIASIVSVNQRASLEYCRPTCDPSTRDAMTTSTTLTYVSLTTGVAVLGVSLLTYLLRPTVERPTRLSASEGGAR